MNAPYLVGILIAMFFCIPMQLQAADILFSHYPIKKQTYPWKISMAANMWGEHDKRRHINYETGEAVVMNRSNSGFGFCVDPPEKQWGNKTLIESQINFGLCYSRFQNSFHNTSNLYAFNSELVSPVSGLPPIMLKYRINLQFHSGVMGGLATGYEEGQMNLVTGEDLAFFGFVHVGVRYWIPAFQNKIGVKFSLGYTPALSGIGYTKYKVAELLYRL